MPKGNERVPEGIESRDGGDRGEGACCGTAVAAEDAVPGLGPLSSFGGLEPSPPTPERDGSAVNSEVHRPKRYSLTLDEARQAGSAPALGESAGGVVEDPVLARLQPSAGFSGSPHNSFPHRSGTVMQPPSTATVRPAQMLEPQEYFPGPDDSSRRALGRSDPGSQGAALSWITRSGLQTDKNGGRSLVTQGQSKALLVAGKQCLFRLFLSPSELRIADSVVVTVTARQGPFGPGTSTRAIHVPRNKLFYEWAAPNGPSVGVIVRGCAFPRGGFYDVTLLAVSRPDVLGSLHVVAMSRLGTLAFNDTVDIRLRIVPYYDSTRFFPMPAWETDIARAMTRIGLIWPVRDGVAGLDEDTCSGLRYLYDKANPANWTDDISVTLDPTLAWNQKVKGDRIDSTCLFRWVLGAERSGGNGGVKAYKNQILRYSTVVSGPDSRFAGQSTTPGVCAQEIGHTFGLEPPDSPFFDGAAHSILRSLPPDPFAFDFATLTVPAPGSIGDPLGTGWGAAILALNTFDWDYLLTTAFGISGSDVTGTATHPCTCFGDVGPVAPRAEPQALVGSRADGPLIVIGPKGPGPGPGDPIRIRSLGPLAGHLGAGGVTIVHGPAAEDLEGVIVSPPGPVSSSFSIGNESLL